MRVSDIDGRGCLIREKGVVVATQECWHQALSKYWTRGEQATGGASRGWWGVEAVSQGTLITKTAWL